MAYEGAEEEWTNSVVGAVWKQGKTGNPFYKQNSEDLVTDYLWLVKGKE